MGFARYLNRGQQMTRDMKTDMSAYEYIPDQISTLNPAPRFPFPAFDKNMGIQKMKRDATANANRLRTSALVKRVSRDRFHAGRLHAHVKLHEIKQEVQKIKEKEKETARQTVVRTRGIEAPNFEVDDQFMLPYGLSYDNVIKKKAELIDSLKVANNVVMDELIERLGYMDYRDALACNRYILEAKRSGDYHQLARASVLQTALSKLNSRKRMQLEEAAKRQSKEAGESVEEVKLRKLMKEDSEVASLYQDTLFNVRAEKEEDY